MPRKFKKDVVSAREQEFLQLLAAGFSYGNIANIWDVEYRTTMHYSYRIIHEIYHVDNIGAAMVKAEKLGHLTREDFRKSKSEKLAEYGLSAIPNRAKFGNTQTGS